MKFSHHTCLPVVLCGGKSTRMKNFFDKPKQFVKFDQYPSILHSTIHRILDILPDTQDLILMTNIKYRHYLQGFDTFQKLKIR